MGLSSCNTAKEPYLIFDRTLVDQALVDSIRPMIPENIYMEIKIISQGDVSYMMLSKYNNIFVTEGELADDIRVISVYDYNSNKAYQYFSGDSLTEEEKTYGIELSLTQEEIDKGIDYQLESLDGLGNVVEAYLTQYEGQEAIYIKSSYEYESAEVEFIIYMSTEYSYPLYMQSSMGEEESVEIIVTTIEKNHAFSKAFPDIPSHINFTNYDDFEG